MTRTTVIFRFPRELERGMAEIVQSASRFASKIYLSYGNKKVNAKSIMGMMTIEVEDGDRLTIEADGPDETEAINAMVSMLSES